MPESRLHPTIGEGAEVSVIAVRTEPAGKIALQANLLIPASTHESSRCGLLVASEISYGRSRTQLRIFRWAGDEIDRAANRVGTIKRGPGTAQYFDTLK